MTHNGTQAHSSPNNGMAEPARTQVLEECREQMTAGLDALRTMLKLSAAERDCHRDRGMER